MGSSRISIDKFDIAISREYDEASLRQQWLSIQKGQKPPFFLTWSWISCWLDTYKPEIIVVTAGYRGETVAIGLFTHSIQVRHHLISSSQYRLHQMGDQLLDQIWMEYNDFICVEQYRVDAVNACIKALEQSDSSWDEIILSMITDSRAKDIKKNISDCRVLMSNRCYSKDLVSVRDNQQDYIESLSPNTRYQIRRSIRLYQSLHGELGLSLAHSREEALAYFHEAGKFHRLRWRDSGYNNERFVSFHENLIINSFAEGSVHLMKITSGDTTLAILYFHLVDDDVYFYLQGINYEDDKKLKPGMVAHAMASQYYLDAGMKKYDYMGGYSQYKCQLSSPADELVTLCIQKPALKFYLENLGRSMKNMLESIVPGSKQ